MIHAVARAIMIVAERCLGKAYGEWARAMRIELDAAVPGGRRLQFAIGCLIAALREMPRHREGRISLVSHVLALAFLVPMAAMLLLQAGRLGHSAYVHGLVDTAGSQNPFLAGGQLSAAPALLLLWLVLGSAHLHLAWVLAEKDWSRVFNAGAMILAGTATLAIYACVLVLYDALLALHTVATAIELTAVFVVARWHDRNGAFSSRQESA